MTRAICEKCHRPLSNCICHLFYSISNDIEVVILQHPSETSQSKGSVTLLANSLSNCQVLQGECFENNTEFERLITKEPQYCALLYPSDNALFLDGKVDNKINNSLIKRLVLLDGTWKKAYRLYKVNSVLRDLIHVKLPNDIPNLYQARVSNKAGGLSTLEATCHALSFLDNDVKKYQQLLKNFVSFNEQLMSYRPK